MIKKNIFGPVLSRRLGYSLGVDLVPRKTCNLDCLYCEVCPTNRHTETRDQFVDIEQLVNEIKALKHDFDYITLTGSGEPTLQINLDKIISRLKTEFKTPIVMLTNSLLLRFSEVRQELLELDLILPSLDAVFEDSFQKVNRPVEGVNASQVVEGLIEFRKIFKGQIWLEVLLVEGINDSVAEIEQMDKVFSSIKPDRVQLNTVVRPPAFGVKGISYERLLFIKNSLKYPRVEIIALNDVVSNVKKELDEKAIIDYLIRRPATFEEIYKALVSDQRLLREKLDFLIKNKIITKKVFNGQVFFVFK